MPSPDKAWIKAYQALFTNWRVEPDWALIEYQKLFAQGPVLDLGMGNGRNALFFVKMGYEVECVDVSNSAVKKCQNSTIPHVSSFKEVLIRCCIRFAQRLSGQVRHNPSG